MGDMNKAFEQQILTEIIRKFPPLALMGDDFLPIKDYKTDKVFYSIITGGYTAAPAATRDSAAPIIKAKSVEEVEVKPIPIKAKLPAPWSDAVSILDENGEQLGEDYILEKLKDVSEAVDVSIEAFRFMALTGALNFKVQTAGGAITKSIDLGFTNTHKMNLTGGQKWDAPTTSAPLTDISTAIALISEDSGATADRIYMNSVTRAAMLKSSAVLASITASMGPDDSLESRIQKYFANLGLTLKINDQRYVDYFTGSGVKLIPDGYAFVVAANFMGQTIGKFQTVPSDYNRVGGKGQPGKFARRYTQEDPPVEMLLAGVYGFPAVQHVDRVVAIKAF